MRVIAVSRPGYLGTPLADGETPEAQADLYAALLDTLGIARAVSSRSPPAAERAGLRAAPRHALPRLDPGFDLHRPLAMPPEVARRFR